MKCPDKDLRYGICKRCLTENPDDRFKSELIIRVCSHPVLIRIFEYGSEIVEMYGNNLDDSRRIPFSVSVTVIVEE